MPDVHGRHRPPEGRLWRHGDFELADRPRLRLLGPGLESNRGPLPGIGDRSAADSGQRLRRFGSAEEALRVRAGAQTNCCGPVARSTSIATWERAGRPAWPLPTCIGSRAGTWTTPSSTSRGAARARPTSKPSCWRATTWSCPPAFRNELAGSGHAAGSRRSEEAAHVERRHGPVSYSGSHQGKFFNMAAISRM